MPVTDALHPTMLLSKAPRDAKHFVLSHFMTYKLNAPQNTILFVFHIFHGSLEGVFSSINH